MTTMPHADRSRLAHAALAEARPDGHLSIQCPHGHHIAKVIGTGAGPVYRSVPRSRSHGDRDLPDPVRRGSPPEWLDLLELGDDADPLPAWCDCGPRSLDRSAVRQWVRDRARTVIIE